MLVSLHALSAKRRCSRAVDSMLDGSPKLVTIDEETHDYSAGHMN